MNTKNSHIRHGFGAVRPYACGPLELLGFVEAVFGARELERHSFSDEHFHVEYQIGDSVLVIEAGTLPAEYAPWTNSIFVYVEDVDAVFNRAEERGVEVVQEVADRPYAERMGGFKDMAGNTWWISTHRTD